MARTKAAAIFLGPEGVGLMGILNNIIGLIRVASSLGINSSGVREIAEAAGSTDPLRIGVTVTILRRVCWLTGFLGWGLAILLAWPISQMTFGDHAHASSIAILGFSILLTSISAGQMAFLQGIRRIGDLAKAGIVGGLLSAGFSIGLFWQLGVDGIVPSILSVATVGLLVSWWFARLVPIPDQVLVRWHETWPHSKRLLSLGLAMMWSGLLVAGTTLIQNAYIVRELGLDANGYYSAAWALSGMFAGFVLNAMGTDYFPRLTAVAHDNQKMCDLVNQQTEIGILLALPGLVATIIFAPLAIRLFYSADFSVAADLLPWFVMGVFVRILSWPMGFILLAKGFSRWFASVETVSHFAHLGLAIFLIDRLGLIGIAFAFVLFYVVHCIGSLAITYHLINHSPSNDVRVLFGKSLGFIACIFTVRFFCAEPFSFLVGSIISLASAIFSLRELLARIGTSNRIIQTLSKIPGFRWILVL